MAANILRRSTKWEPELIIVQMSNDDGKFIVSKFTRSNGWRNEPPFDTHTEANIRYDNLLSEIYGHDT